jgi:hypothetical protein
VPAPLRWVGAILTLLLIAIAIFVSVFQWNWLRGPIDTYLSGRLHRQVTIHGDLSAKIWSWTPTATANDVTVAEPGWAGRGQMVAIPRLTVGIDFKRLLGGRLVIAVIDAQRPTVLLQRDASGRNNWTFSPPGAAPQPLKLPPIRHFSIDDGRLTLDDARRKLHFVGQVSSNERLTGYGRGRFTMTGKGTLNSTPFFAQILGGALLNVDPDKPYPFTTDIRAGSTHVLAKGVIPKPFDLGQLRADGSVTGQDLANLYYLTGFALPNSPPYQLAGHLTRNDSSFEIAGLHGHVGASDVSGRLAGKTVDGRRKLTGDLTSRHLKLADLTAVIGGAPRGAIRGTVASPTQKAMAAKLTAEGRVFPDAHLDVARVRQMDADVRYRAETVDAGPLPIRQASLHVRLDHGLLTLSPLSLVLPQGALSGQVRLDARGATPVTAVDLTLARAQVQELLPGNAGAAPPLQGPLEAKARLTGTGDSVRAAAGSANGTFAVAIPQGQMRQLLAELMGIDVTKSLFLYLSKDQKPTPVRCAVAEFQARDGVLTARRILIDTGVVQAQGKGTIDLKNERLNLALTGKPKHFRLVRIPAPITLKGRLDDPKLGVDFGKAAPQLGAAAILGALVSPAAVILPFLGINTAKDADCTALLSEAAADGAPVAAR